MICYVSCELNSVRSDDQSLKDAVLDCDYFLSKLILNKGVYPFLIRREFGGILNEKHKEELNFISNNLRKVQKQVAYVKYYVCLNVLGLEKELGITLDLNYKCFNVYEIILFFFRLICQKYGVAVADLNILTKLKKTLYNLNKAIFKTFQKRNIVHFHEHYYEIIDVVEGGELPYLLLRDTWNNKCRKLDYCELDLNKVIVNERILRDSEKKKVESRKRDLKRRRNDDHLERDRKRKRLKR